LLASVPNTALAERPPINTVSTTTYALTPVTRVENFQRQKKVKRARNAGGKGKGKGKGNKKK